MAVYETRKLKMVRWHILNLALSVVVLAIGYEVVRLVAGALLPEISPFLPTTLSLVTAIWRLGCSKELYSNLITTGYRICVSLSMTVIVGALLGLAIGAFPLLHRRVRPAWDFMRSIPPSALFPFLVLLLGMGPNSKIATTWFTTTLIYSLGVADAASITQRQRGRFYAIIGVRRVDWYVAVLLPEALLRSVSSLRIVASITTALMIVCEMFLGAVDGFGGMIIGFSESLRYADLLAAIAVAGGIGYTLNLAVDHMEKAARRRVKADEDGLLS